MGRHTKDIYGLAGESNLAMAYKPKPWPYQALGALEDTLSYLRDIERATAIAQKAVVEGNKLDGVILMSDIRTKAMLAHSTLVAAKAGEYESNVPR